MFGVSRFGGGGGDVLWISKRNELSPKGDRRRRFFGPQRSQPNGDGEVAGAEAAAILTERRLRPRRFV